MLPSSIFQKERTRYVFSRPRQSVIWDGQGTLRAAHGKDGVRTRWDIVSASYRSSLDHTRWRCCDLRISYLDGLAERDFPDGTTLHGPSLRKGIRGTIGGSNETLLTSEYLPIPYSQVASKTAARTASNSFSSLPDRIVELADRCFPVMTFSRLTLRCFGVSTRHQVL